MSYLISFIIHFIILYLLLFFIPSAVRDINQSSSGVGFMNLVNSRSNQAKKTANKRQFHNKNGKNNVNTIVHMNFAGNINQNNLNSYAFKKGNFMPPTYPSLAIDNQHEGVVVLVVFLNNQNKIKRIELYKTSGYSELDETALTNAKKHWLGKQIKNSTSKKIIINVKFSLIK